MVLIKKAFKKRGIDNLPYKNCPFRMNIDIRKGYVVKHSIKDLKLNKTENSRPVKKIPSNVISLLVSRCYALFKELTHNK